MHTNLEIEYKVMITAEQFKNIIQAYPDRQIIHQTNTYFKPFQSKQKSSIRIREINGEFLFTLKIPTEEGVLEKETKVNDNSIEVLNTPEILSCLKSFDIQGPFIKEGVLHTERHFIKDEYGELCIDKNNYGSCIDYELEYEVKKDPQKGYKRFLNILKKHHIEYIPSKLSKYARCIQSES